MRLTFYLDPESGEPHIWRHKVEEEEVAEVLVSDGLRWRAGDGKTVVVGQTAEGRLLQVVFVESKERDAPILVITAYPPKKEMISACRRKMRKKGNR